MKWLNLKSLCGSLLSNDDLESVFYFTSTYKEKFKGDQTPRRQQLYLRALESSGVQIIYGKTVKKSEWKRVASRGRKGILQPEMARMAGITQYAITRSFHKAEPDLPRAAIFQYSEKGTDVNIATKLMSEFFKNPSNSALLISGDTDLIPPVEFLVQNGVKVSVVVPNDGQKSARWRSTGCELRVLSNDELSKHLFPQRYVSPKGRQIHCPPQWRQDP